MGAAVFTYPKEVGLPFGGPDYNPYIRLEMHYNNPDLVAGWTDSSGMRIKFVNKLRKYDAAVMELGLEYTDKMAIPPGQLAFPLSGYCIQECTKLAFPKGTRIDYLYMFRSLTIWSFQTVSLSSALNFTHISAESVCSRDTFAKEKSWQKSTVTTFTSITFRKFDI
jgi:Copper type II ascorbate-dependent monooxygenase, N-terminal domain/Copper type II ascorbate-dependent monooxygenase, C-terminal domain